MKDNPHIIQKLMTELIVGRDVNTLAIQQRVERLLEEQLIPRLEPVFDQLAGPDEWIDIDRLDLDLGELSLQQSDDEWLEKSYQTFRMALENLLAKPETQRQNPPQQQLQLLSYFLQYGYLPWWAVGTDLQQVAEQTISRQPEKVLALLASSHTRKRWVLQFPKAHQQALLTALVVKIPISISSWCKLFPARLYQQIAFIYWQSTWQVAQQAKLTAKTWKKQLVQNVTIFYPELVKQEPNITQDKQLREKLEALALLPACWGEPLQNSATKPLIQEKLDLTTEQSVQDSQLTSESESLPSKPARDAEGLYILLAGIVLVHPFLQTFFERLGLLEGELFKDFQTQEKAVHLLYYLATGLQFPIESELVLLKLFCGLEPEIVISREVLLTETEKQEADNLLLALIGHWPAIEGTSPEELRGSFLIREGKLVLAELGWQLTIEQTAFDVLLSRLNWGLSPIQLPWMQQMIWVDWV